MALSEEKIKQSIRRLLLSRMRILCNHGFFGLLLMHMTYAIDEELDTACTDGVRITFGTDFLEELSDAELDFVMMHEIMHVALQHCTRYGDRNADAFNIACDIVVNSNILLENQMDISSITLQKYGTSMHVAPNGKEGYEYTAEQIYEMLPAGIKKSAKKVGVNLRTLQQYEIRAKDINKAAGATLLALSKVLGCRVEDLLEYDSSEIDDNEE